MLSDVFIHGFLASLFAGLVTGVGGFMIFLKKKYSQDNIDCMLNIAAGVMLAASFFSLLVPSMSRIITFDPDIHVAAFWYVAAVFTGVAFVWILNSVLPHEHSNMGRHGLGFSLKTAWLFIIAITLHKIPEGLAVGVAYSGEDFMNPDSLVLGIAFHNIPEGLTIAISLVAAKCSRLKAALAAAAIGMVQPLGAIIGLLTMGFSAKLVPLGMAMAGGTLLFVVVNEILPETYKIKKTNQAAFALFTGFIAMTYITMVLD